MKQVPQRTCIGCLTKQPKEKLIRLIVKNGQVVFDPTSRASSRGAYLCKTGKGIKKSCFKKAKERDAFKRAFRKRIKVKL